MRNPLLRWLMQMSGAADPDGKAPIDVQLSLLGHRREVRKAAERMLAWAPERIILSHGRCYEANGTAELRRAFRWVLQALAMETTAVHMTASDVIVAVDAGMRLSRRGVEAAMVGQHTAWPARDAAMAPRSI